MEIRSAAYMAEEGEMVVKIEFMEGPLLSSIIVGIKDAQMIARTITKTVKAIKDMPKE